MNLINIILNWYAGEFSLEINWSKEATIFSVVTTIAIGIIGVFKKLAGRKDLPEILRIIKGK